MPRTRTSKSKRVCVSGEEAAAASVQNTAPIQKTLASLASASAASASAAAIANGHVEKMGEVPAQNTVQPATLSDKGGPCTCKCDMKRLRQIIAAQPRAAAKLFAALTATPNAAHQKHQSGGADQSRFRAPAVMDPEQALACQFIETPEFTTFCASHPEVKRVVDAVSPEYKALRQRAISTLFDACSRSEMDVPGLPTDVSSTDVIFALRLWLMRNESLTEAQAETLVRNEMRTRAKVSESVIKSTVLAVMEAATALIKAIQQSTAPAECFTFMLMPNLKVVLMEMGLFAAARRRCAVCAAAGVRRCIRCGLVWYCAAACQLAHWGPDTAISASGQMDVKTIAPDVKSGAAQSDVKSSVAVSSGVKSALASSAVKSRVATGLRPWHSLTCAGPPVDRSVFRAAQRLLAEGFRPIENVVDFSDSSQCVVDRLPDTSAGQQVRTAVYQAALLDLAKPPAANASKTMKPSAASTGK
jgi:hypothetical protein